MIDRARVRFRSSGDRESHRIAGEFFLQGGTTTSPSGRHCSGLVIRGYIGVGIALLAVAV